MFYFPAKVFILFLRRLGRRNPNLERATSPAVFVIRTVFALLAVDIVLENLGISLTAVWTTLGVGSVAVALALQDTLGNMFAALYLLADGPVRPDEYIKLDSGQEGYVVRIGWRSTTLRMLANNVVGIRPDTVASVAKREDVYLPTNWAVGLLVAVDGGDHDVLEAQLAHGVGQVHRGHRAAHAQEERPVLAAGQVRVALLHVLEPARALVQFDAAKVFGRTQQGHGEAGVLLQPHVHAQPGGMLRDAEVRTDCREGIVIQSLLGGPPRPRGGKFVVEPFAELAVEIEVAQRREARR
jgi:hypothetical protein